ncbi:MAG: HNH endonuclease domain protein [Candidatus Woesebacteria bacterium GW2011_GWB1_39_12]|uniref:HNH endonuclease domain protein n=1 Tax=Candidatus Woesebacteria bacterium GW2011_GWB1_39_12 TaxID=1618574 RepID=A0A0G0Q657_9BACT|nr:MAG: HNH endonuclease domain protein [Candidatus Woesebacteria bacterium GW2011_GWB1_39_12]
MRNKKGQFLKGFPHNKGIKRIMTEEHKEKISNSLKGKKKLPFSEEHKRKIGLAKKGKRPSLETRKKMSENSGRWKGGITPEIKKIRVCFEYRQWISDVFTRDNFTCQECGKRGGDLEAHHLKSFSKIINENKIGKLKDALNCSELWNINNGQTLCKSCHKKTFNFAKKRIL